MGRFSIWTKVFTFMNKVGSVYLNIMSGLLYSDRYCRASITAMYYVTLKMVRNEEAYIVRSFLNLLKIISNRQRLLI